MQIPKINWQNVKTSLQNTGDYAWKAIQGANNRFDEFVSSKNYDPKTVKQVSMVLVAESKRHDVISWTFPFASPIIIENKTIHIQILLIIHLDKIYIWINKIRTIFLDVENGRTKKFDLHKKRF